VALCDFAGFNGWAEGGYDTKGASMFVKAFMVVLVFCGLLVLPALPVNTGSPVARCGVWSPERIQTTKAVSKKTVSESIAIAQVRADGAPSDLEKEDAAAEDIVEIADPLCYWNKGMYYLNDKLYFWVLKPVARGYRWAVPEGARRGVRRFFHNLGFPVRFVNCLLQAKGSEAAGEFGRFVMNTTCGVVGFGNPASDFPRLNPPEEDLGQTLGVWRMGHGFYVVWPFMGPSTVRDSVGLLGDSFLDPLSYIEPRGASAAITAGATINEISFRIGDYEALKEAAVDPYVSMRDAYVYRRNKEVEE
jgi:phospholipid-binding lipoprotein MlaA